jgi:Cryptococcal mannosyltransferase 1
MFDPIDAIQLLFSTNVNSATGRTDYGAACAMDFINPFKFYDRYALRDAEGYTSGIPFFPWFTNAGTAASRRDVLDQKDAVRVRSCWGGMAAFEGKWFQAPVPSGPPSPFGFEVSPLRFRSEQEIFWEASECCLIHADLTHLRQTSEQSDETGIFVNPYIRVAYDSDTLGWLRYTRRVEGHYSSVHNILNYLVGMPEDNPRRLEQAGNEYTETVWNYDGPAGDDMIGSYRQVSRKVPPGRFCGEKAEMVLIDDPLPGQPRWQKLPAPDG